MFSNSDWFYVCLAPGNHPLGLCCQFNTNQVWLSFIEARKNLDIHCLTIFFLLVSTSNSLEIWKSLRKFLWQKSVISPICMPSPNFIIQGLIVTDFILWNFKIGYFPKWIVFSHHDHKNHFTNTHLYDWSGFTGWLLLYEKSSKLFPYF